MAHKEQHIIHNNASPFIVQITPNSHYNIKDLKSLLQLRNGQQQQSNQRSPPLLQREHHPLYQQQPQQEPNRSANSNSNKGQHHPRPPTLIHIAPPQQKEEQQQPAMTSSPSPPPRKESLKNARALAGAGVGAGSECGSVSAQEQVLLDDRAHYRAMMMASADSAVSLTGEADKNTEYGDNSGNNEVWVASPSSQSLDSRSNSLSNTAAAANQSGGSDTCAVGTPRQGSTEVATGVGGGESPLAQPNLPLYPQKAAAAAAAGREGVSKSRSGSLSSAHAHVVRGPGWQTRMPGGGNGGGSVIVDMGTSTPQPPVPSSPGKTGWEREDATPTTPVPAYQFPAPKNGGTDNGKDSGTGAGAGVGGHQHSHSLFDFFRGRKSSIHKNSAFHQQAAAAAAVAYAASHGSGSGFGSESLAGADAHPPALPLMSTPPSIARSRLGSVAALGPPVPQPLRKQSLDVSVLSGYHHHVPGAAGGPLRLDRHSATMPILPFPTSSSVFGVSRVGALTPTQAMEAITSSAIPLTPTVTASANVGAMTSSNSTQSTLSKVAAAVVGVTVGKRRPSIVSEVDAGAGGNGLGLLKFREKPPPVRLVAKQQQQQVQYQHQYNGVESDGFGGGGGMGLDAEQLQNHARFMRSEKSMTELMEYVDRMYHTVMNKDVALEYSRTQISVLRKELDQNRVRSEDDRKSLTAEVDTVKEQVVKMEENFLLWRTKVHNDQMAHQEEFLQESLVKQDRMEELEDMLYASQEEVTRLRNRLLVLEYEDEYVGPTAFLSSPTTTSFAPDYNHLSDPYNHSTTIAIEHGPITVNSHKRRSGDFRIMEQRAQSFEGQVQELKKAMEKSKQDQGKDLAELRMKFGAKCSKLEHDVHAAKMESTMYNEMLHEVVTENDDLRKQLKDAQRQLRRQGLSTSTSTGSSSGSSTNTNNNYSSGSNSSNAAKSKSSSRPRRNPDHYGFPDDGSYSLDGSDDDDMEDIVI
ncbi:hypothetical protein BGX30_012725 [Mortierella sp. GBA39]|nr:hypothetical protein BGX30_012725 [Mortierella sp. GBA39]